MIRSRCNPWPLVGPLQDTLRDLEREYAYSITTLDNRLQQNAVNERMSATLAVLRMLLREGVTLTVTGVAFGIPAGIIASRGLRTLLFGVSGSDPLVAAAVAVSFLLLTIAAVLIPARRGAGLAPVAALRAE